MAKFIQARWIHSQTGALMLELRLEVSPTRLDPRRSAWTDEQLNVIRLTAIGAAIRGIESVERK